MSKKSETHSVFDLIDDYGMAIAGTVFLVGFVIIAVITIVTHTANAMTDEAKAARRRNDEIIAERFGDGAVDGAIGDIDAIVDQTNGVTYIVRFGSQSSSMTVLLDADGKPHIDEEWLSQHQNN